MASQAPDACFTLIYRPEDAAYFVGHEVAGFQAPRGNSDLGCGGTQCLGTDPKLH